MSTTHFHYGSIAALQSSIKARPINETIESEHDHYLRMGDRNPEWLNMSVSEARAILGNHSWTEGVKRAKECASDISAPMVQSVRRRKTRSNFGSELDINRVYSGDLDRAWSSTKRQARKGGKDIRLVCPINASSSTPAESLFWRGAAALVLAEKLTTAGYRVEIIGETYVERLDVKKVEQRYLESVVIKSAKQRLDINSLAVALCLPAFFRLTLFDSRMRIKEVKKMSGGLGVTIKSCPPELKTDNTIFVKLDDMSKRGAKKFLADTLKQFEG